MISRFSLFCTIFCTGALLFSGCVSLDKGSLRATNVAPESAQVDEQPIARDSSLPQYVMVIEPIRIENDVYISRSDTEVNLKGDSGSLLGGNMDGRIKSNRSASASRLASNQVQIQAQLASALSNVGNFSVAELTQLRKSADGTQSIRLSAGEVGPFIVRALITEYEDKVEESKSGSQFIVYGSKDKVRKGLVALDVQIVDGRTGRLAAAYPVKGTFSRQDKSAKVLLGAYEQSKMAQSVMDQALRVALNNAATKAFEKLSRIR